MPTKTKKPGFRPASVYENKVFNLCVAGAAPQTYANFTHTDHCVSHHQHGQPAPIPHFPPVTSTGDSPPRASDGENHIVRRQRFRYFWAMMKLDEPTWPCFDRRPGWNLSLPGAGPALPSGRAWPTRRPGHPGNAPLPMSLAIGRKLRPEFKRAPPG
jgi:hypothetical protein